MVSIRIARLHRFIYRARRSTAWLAACFLSNVSILHLRSFVDRILSTVCKLFFFFNTSYLFRVVFHVFRKESRDSNEDKKHRFNEMDENWYPFETERTTFYWICRLFFAKYFFLSPHPPKIVTLLSNVNIRTNNVIHLFVSICSVLIVTDVEKKEEMKSPKGNCIFAPKH